MDGGKKVYPKKISRKKKNNFANYLSKLLTNKKKYGRIVCGQVGGVILSACPKTDTK